MTEFNEIGCRNCGDGNGWNILTDGLGNFRAVHGCGHVLEFRIVKEPDKKPIDMRFFH